VWRGSGKTFTQKVRHSLKKAEGRGFWLKKEGNVITAAEGMRVGGESAGGFDNRGTNPFEPSREEKMKGGGVGEKKGGAQTARKRKWWAEGKLKT